MNIITRFIEFILHFDKHLGAIISQFGTLVYGILFLIIFAETGFVLTPFLPGDSLLFTAGAFAAKGVLHIYWLWLLLFLAVLCGDNVNYFVGYYLGPRVFKEGKLFHPEYLEKTKIFYAKHGKKTLILARFVPIIRTFAPFVAGIGRMKYSSFFGFSVLGGFLWVSLFLFGGYFFGNLAFVREHFSLFILGIIVVSLIPLVVEVVKHKRHEK